jgi:predicted AAA+ superfamily ATPase
MAHIRPRYLESIIQKALGFSPIVGVLGHRQVGKTTLLERISTRYESLDSAKTLSVANEDPEKFISSPQTSRPAGPTGIDECQLAPALFPALKEHVRKIKIPGQFLLSGSIRFTSRKAIQESLTGRIVNLQLLPFTTSELESEPLPNIGVKALQYADLSSLPGQLNLHSNHLIQRKKWMETYLVQGGLPGVCFIRDSKLRNLQIDSQLETLLDRDLRFVQKTNLSFGLIRSLVTTLAKSQGEPLDYTALQKESGISTPTIKKLLYAFEAIFLIRLIPIEGGKKGLVLFFEDQAEAHRLIGSEQKKIDRMIHFAFQHLRAQFEYRLGEHTTIFQYRTRGGAILPLCFKNNEGTLGIIILESADDASRAIAPANSFLKTYMNSKVLLLHPGKEVKVLQPRILLAPLVAVT